MEKTKLVEPLAKGVALASAILYGLGFVVVNAYLSKFGTLDFTLTNPRFVFAGALCAMYFFFWWLFIGQYVVSIDKSMSSPDLPTISKTRKFIIVTNLLVTEIAFRICIATLTFSATTFEGLNFLDPACGLIVLPGIAIIFLERLVPSIIGIVYIFFKSLVQLSAAIGFIILADTNQQHLSASYFALFLLFMMFYEIITKKSHDTESISGIVYYVVFLLGSTITFGYSIYGDTKPQYGGGHPISVTVISKEKLPNDLVFQDVDNRFKAQLLY